jgi:hypothetical protein
MIHQDHLDHLLSTAADDIVFANYMDHGVPKHIPEFVQGGQFAPAPESRVHRQNAAIPDRRLQQQLAQIAGENLDRVQLGPFRQLAPHLAFQAGKQQSAERVPQAVPQELGMGMIRTNQTLLGALVQRPQIDVDFDAKNFGTFAPIDGQQPMWRNLCQRLLVAKIILERFDFLLALPLFGFLAARAAAQRTAARTALRPWGFSRSAPAAANRLRRRPGIVPA